MLRRISMAFCLVTIALIFFAGNVSKAAFLDGSTEKYDILIKTQKS